MPGCHEYVDIRSKEEFEDVVHLRIWKWRENPGLSRWAQGDPKSPHKRKAGWSDLEKCEDANKDRTDVLSGGGRRVYLLCCKVGCLVPCSSMLGPVGCTQTHS